MYTFHTLSTRLPNKKNLSLLFFAALALRATVFFFYVQHEERYQQPDSGDYHIYAATIVTNTPMLRYWRTPGYPLYLTFFYRIFGFQGEKFSANSSAQKAAIWGQIILSSCIPIILFFLAYALTASCVISWLTAWISVFHVGLVLASTYLLTEGVALIFFYLFLLFFYASFRAYGETLSLPAQEKQKSPKASTGMQKLFSHAYCSLALAALCLGIFTWMRPMGEFIAVVAVLILLFFARDSWKTKLKKTTFFALFFCASIAPWYARNYQRTGKLFFCPMFGMYLNAFTAPRILRDLQGVPLEKTWGYLQQQLRSDIQKEVQKIQQTGQRITPYNVPVVEFIAGAIAWPIVLAHPALALMEWLKEVCITAFDLYSYQLIGFVKNNFKCDPLEAFLGARIAECLYQQPAPMLIRIICWLDLVFSIALWLGLFAGAWLFLLDTLFKKFRVLEQIKALGGLWLKTCFLIGAVIFMTGGFGYSRLRLPVEPLMIILALTAWAYLRKKNKTQQKA